MYDAYISLGDNCEAGLQFERIGYSESSFLSYAYAPYEAIVEVIKNGFENVFLRENIVPLNDAMVQDVHYGFHFHTRLLSKIDDRGERNFLTEYDFDEVYQQQLAEVRYLADKWDALINSDKRVLYIVKQEQNSSKERAEYLTYLMKTKYPSHDFTILYLQLEANQEPDWGTPFLTNRYFSKFAPSDALYDADIEAWDKVFLDFPLKDHSLSKSLKEDEQLPTAQPYERILYHTAELAGLCNHLRSLCACLSMGHFWDVPVSMYWSPSPLCDCFYEELFEPVCHHITEEEAMSIIKEPPPNTLYLTDENGGPYHYYKTYCEDVNIDDFFHKLVLFQRELTIKPYLQDAIDDFLIHNWSDDIVGLHVRRTDHIEWFSQNADVAPKLSTDEKFFQAMENEIEQGTSKFFLATDNSETETLFKERFAGKIVTYCRVFDALKNRQTSIQDALVDLYLLSKTNRIIGSYYSSFSEYAAALGGIQLRNP